MDKSTQKIITLSFLTFAILIYLSFNLLLKAFASSFGVVARFQDIAFVKHGFPVLLGLSIFLFLQFNKDIHLWASEVVLEIKKVVWPSRKDVTAMTIVVIVMVIISSVIITTFDFISGYVVSYLMRL